MICQENNFAREVAWELYQMTKDNRPDDPGAAAYRQREPTSKRHHYRSKGKGRGKNCGSTSGGRYPPRSWKYHVEPRSYHPHRSQSWNYRAGSSRDNDPGTVKLRPSRTIKPTTRPRATVDHRLKRDHSKTFKSSLKRDHSNQKGPHHDRKR